MKTFRYVSILFGLTALGQPGEAAAEDAPFIVEHLPPHLEARVRVQASRLHLTSIGSPDEYFISKLKIWDTTTPINVCFFGGSSQLRSQIAEVALKWSTAGGYLPLNFGDVDDPDLCSSTRNYDIRVGFRYKGYWSLVGTDSKTLASQNEQSMNLALFDIVPPDEPEFSRVVLHEFGHALGFQHEHQSYKAPCVNEFDWDAIYSYLQGDRPPMTQPPLI